MIYHLEYISHSIRIEPLSMHGRTKEEHSWSHYDLKTFSNNFLQYLCKYKWKI